MFVRWFLGSEAGMTCDCGHEFDVDACFQENLWYNGVELVEKCPECGLLNPEKTSEVGVDKTKFRDTMLEGTDNAKV